jgi:hypothetical protein
LKVDWSRPWLADYRAKGEAAAARVERGVPVAAALNALADASVPVRFVAHDAAGDEPYEAYIARTACVPTRDNLHDFFNGLVWLQHPRLKRRLNRLQAGEIARARIGPRRGARRDALTLLDESGLLIDAPADLLHALEQRDWARLLVGERERWLREVRLTLIGHAVLEKLATPFKTITAQVWLRRGPLRSKPFAPLPVLGVPGWWGPNRDAGFYADASVFRPLRGTIQR